MKNKILITTIALSAGAALISYLLKRMKAVIPNPKSIPAKKSHHITDVFSHAKNR
jgi:hypothetical protein